MAELLCFPLCRRVGKARHVAQLYARKVTEREAVSYWRQVITTLDRELQRLGFDECLINSQLSAFREAVTGELRILERRRLSGSDNGPGAA